MDCLYISLFGKFRVTAHNEAPLPLETTKVQELFFYLLLHANRPHPREKLAELLWQGSSETQSRKYLRHALWQLQSTLDESTGIHNLLVTDADWIQINPNASYWLDTQEFETAYVRSQGKNKHEISPVSAQAMMDAVTLYKGDLLENWYQDWCIFARERLQNQYLIMLHKLMVYCEITQQYEAGILYGMKMLQCDLAREQTHRRLMRLYFLSGDRTRALRQFERCTAILRAELDVAPAPRTLELVQQIRHGTLAEYHEDNFAVDISTISPPTADFLFRLRQLQETLALAQRQVDSHIEMLQKQYQDSSSTNSA